MVILLFQFHKGTIRTALTLKLIRIFLNFNSIKVQLELTPRDVLQRYDLHFNSIKVQLELVPLRLRPALILFQFHKGTIRTTLFNKVHDYVLNFNSIKVQLEQVVYRSAKRAK